MLTKSSDEQDLSFVIARHRRDGYRREDFDAVYREGDARPGVSGMLTVTYRYTGIERTYLTGFGWDWEEGFSLDLADGVFRGNCASFLAAEADADRQLSKNQKSHSQIRKTALQFSMAV